MKVTAQEQIDLTSKIQLYPHTQDSLHLPDLLQLYKEWVNCYSNQHSLYTNRLDVAWASLLADIDRWQNALGQNQKNHVVCHHLFQFRKFVDSAYHVLICSLQDIAADPTEVSDFRALVIGVFTAQWLLLQNVVAQRIVGSPYRNGLRKLDHIVMTYYARLYNELTKMLDQCKLNRIPNGEPIAAFAPLVYLGNAAQLTVFNHRVPLALCIPISALPSSPSADKAQMAIPHEVAHAIFAQVPELIVEIKGKLKAEIQTGSLKLESKELVLPRCDQTFYLMAVEWTEEICADLLGTALAGEKFAESARWTMADSPSTTGITDATHPPAMLRPIIHLLALSKLEREKEKLEKTRLDLAKSSRDSNPGLLVHPCLERRFRSIPALMFVRMETMSDVLCNLVNRILELPLATLQDKTMGILLQAVYRSKKVRLPRKELPKWGEDPQISSKEFVVDFPADLVPSYTTPGLTTLPAASIIPWIRELLGS